MEIGMQTGMAMSADPVADCLVFRDKLLLPSEGFIANHYTAYDALRLVYVANQFGWRAAELSGRQIATTSSTLTRYCASVGPGVAYRGGTGGEVWRLAPPSALRNAEAGRMLQSVPIIVADGTADEKQGDTHFSSAASIENGDFRGRALDVHNRTVRSPASSLVFKPWRVTDGCERCFARRST